MGEHIQLETLTQQISQEEQAASRVPSYPMPLPVRPSALSTNMSNMPSSAVDPISSRTSPHVSRAPPPSQPPQPVQAAQTPERILPPLDSQPLGFSTSTFSMTSMSMNGASCYSGENIDENILEREDSFFSKSNVAEPKRYADYTTEELKACTDSFRRMIEMMEQKKYSSRALVVNGDEDDVLVEEELGDHMNAEGGSYNDMDCDLLRKSNGNSNSFPLRGKSVTLSEDELRASGGRGGGGGGVPAGGGDHQLLQSFTQTLNSPHRRSQNLHESNTTLPMYNGSNGHYRGGHYKEYDDEDGDVPADNTTTSSNDEDESTNVTLTQLRKCEISV